ncbi:MAG: ABC transporter permease, partial [Moraxellaceae bacterium]|nr:ABC transporter permease [Moraxellaceae bacterium]
PKAVLELGRLQGVLQVEPFRIIPAVLTHGLYRYRGVITGLNNKPSLYRAVDDSFNEVYIRDDGIVLAQALANILHIKAGDILTIEAQEASRPVIQLPVIALANPLLGAPAYYNRLSLSQSLNEGERISGAYLRINSQYSTQIYQKLKKMPVVAGVSLRSEARASFEKMMNTGAGAMRYIMAGIAAIITFGIVYNNARISFAERMRDLSSLRVIGLYKNEASFVLLGELGIITLLALPLGSMLGYFLSDVVATAFSTDIYRVPNYFSASSYGIAALAVILATIASAWLVKRDIDTLDLVATLKVRE